MKVFFLDDSQQRRPRRERMGRLVAVGGICVDESSIRPLETALDRLCRTTGFQPGEEFKWSPSSDHWMYHGLAHDARRSFLLAALGLTAEHDAMAIVVVEDTARGAADFTAASPEEDVVRLFLERAENCLRSDEHGLIIADRSGGGQEDDALFLAGCLDALRQGTRYVQLRRIALAVTAPSHHSRLLQVADVVTGATTARVAGYTRYASPIFAGVRPLLRREGGRIGGVGLKIQPDHLYVNLYHWLAGDTYYRRGDGAVELPSAERPYGASEDAF